MDAEMTPTDRVKARRIQNFPQPEMPSGIFRRFCEFIKNRITRRPTVTNDDTKLEIVWRNPQRLSTFRRRHKFVHEGKQGLYVLEEFVSDGYLGHWNTLSNLEVVAGGRVA
jgi:hypothetical protein